MEKYQSNKVFTPSTPAILTFIEREDVNDQLVDALMTPGTQIIVYGPSGGGKTTLLLNKLNQVYENHIISRCTNIMTFENLILDAFDQLNPYFTQEKGIKGSQKIKSELSTGYLGIKALFGAEVSSEESTKLARIIPPQLTVQRLASFFGISKCCWLLEDFHKVEPKEKVKIAQSMKVFMDTSVEYPDVKMIVIGAVGTARQVVEYDNEMANRVAEIHVPLMKEYEIKEIIHKGEDLLNIKFDETAIKHISIYSGGLASICHGLCLNICFAKGIVETSNTQLEINQEDLNGAIEKYMAANSDTLKKSYDKAIKIQKKAKFENPKIILKAIIDSNQDEVSRIEIFGIIKKQIPNYPQGNLSKYLKELTSENRGEILIFDENSNKYYFSNQFMKVYCLMKFNIIEKIENEKKITITPDNIHLYDEEIKRLATARLQPAAKIKTAADYLDIARVFNILWQNTTIADFTR